MSASSFDYQEHTTRSEIELGVAIDLESIDSSDNSDVQRLDPNVVPDLVQQLKPTATTSLTLEEPIPSSVHGPTTTVCAKVNDDNKHTPLHPQHTDHYSHLMKFKFKKLFKSSEFLGRILILILTLLCCALSTAYCLAQLYDSTLHIVKRCEPKTIEEIWDHSSTKANVTENGNIQLNTASQWGWTSESCWTTSSIDTNTKGLWYSNVYEAKDSETPITVQFVLFGMSAIGFVCIICYNIYTLCRDIISVSRDELHKDSSLYTYFIDNQSQQKQTKPPSVESCLRRRIRDLYSIWLKYMANDRTGWVIRCVISEILEMVVQTQALLLYNGYNLFDTQYKNDIYLANQAHFIVMFAAILSFNCFGSGVLWLSYALLTKCCRGLLFKLLLFFVDQLSDLLYSVFPFFLIMWNTYNANRRDIKVLLAQLNTNSPIAFISTFLPLLLLSLKSLSIVCDAKCQLADRYYKHWKFIVDVTKQKNDSQIMYQARINMYNVDDCIMNKELYDSRGHFVASMSQMRPDQSWIYDNKGQKRSFKKQCILILIALIYIIYGSSVLFIVTNHLNDAQSHCAMVQEEYTLLQRNPELYFWDKCLYKVYPFLSKNEKSIYRHRCQCRALVIQWNNTKSTANIHFGLNQSTVLTAMLEHYFMLEKFQTVGYEIYNVPTRIKSSMFVAKQMKAFEWKNAQIGCIEHGISAWKQLEYLKLDESNLLYGIPTDFSGLESMKYLSFDGNQLPTIPDSICNFSQLEVLYIFLEPKITSIPKCIHKLSNLKEMIVDNCISLQYIPLDIFNLPNLITLSLFNGQISIGSLLDYNNITNKNMLNSNFMFGSHVEDVYLSMNPICNGSILESWFADDVYQVIAASCSYPCDGEQNPSDGVVNNFCPHRLIQNGKCDVECDTGHCFADGGDCIQLCFTETNCSYTDYVNDPCSEECSNRYCASYYGDKFDVVLDTSFDECTKNDSYYVEDTFSNEKCLVSNSTYVDNEFKRKFPHFDWKCADNWIGNGECDDSCRNPECQFDGGDCESGTCLDNFCEFIYDAWLLFVGHFIYTVNNTHFCNAIYPAATFLLGYDPFEQYSCVNQSHRYDFNDDGFVNFREFTSISFQFGGGDEERSMQLNCSECIGIEYYNINLNDDVTSDNTILYDTCDNYH